MNTMGVNHTIPDSRINKGRLDSIDQFRGLAIVFMVLIDYLSRIRMVPAWLKHATETGMHVADAIAPMFIFIIGLTYTLSFQHRFERDGQRQTYMHFLKRSLGLMGFGVFFTFPGVYWELFQIIGSSVLVTLFFIRFPRTVRMLIGVIVLVIHQILLDYGVLGYSIATVWHGILMSLGWASMLILSSAMADFFFDKKIKRMWYVGIVLLILLLGLILSFFIPIRMFYASASYVFINLGLSGIFFIAVDAFTERKNVRWPLLIAWGRNPLVMYFIHYWLWVSIFLGPSPDWWHTRASIFMIVIQATGFLGIMSAVAWFMNRRGWVFSL